MTLVQIELNPDQIIEQVYIGERPAKLYGSAEGSHTTAWSVIRFGLRNALIGLSISDAIQAATRLIKEAQALPGVSLAEGKDYDATLKDKYETARQAVTANKQSVQYQKNPNLAFLQTYASDYLEYRYVIPLSIAHFSKAKGAGESKSIRLLREQTNLERRKRNTQPKGKSEDVMKDESKDEGEEEGKGKSNDVRKEKSEEIRKAMWALLDNKTVLKLATEKPLDALKSMGASLIEDDDERTIQLLTQHLLTLRSAYPQLYTLSEIATVESICAFLTTHGFTNAESVVATFKEDTDEVLKRVSKVPKIFQADLQIEADEEDEAEGDSGEEDTGVIIGGDDRGEDEKGESTNEGETQTNGDQEQSEHPFAVVAFFKGGVLQFALEGRPKGLFRGKKDGDHLTAWGLIERGIIHVSGDFPSAYRQINTLYQAAQKLPGVTRVDNLYSDQKKRYTDAKNKMDGLAQLNGADNSLWLSFIQSYARAYLSYRATVPLSAVGLGTGKGEGEARALRYLDELDPSAVIGANKATLQQMWEQMWKLLDRKALDLLIDAAKRNVNTTTATTRTTTCSQDVDMDTTSTSTTATTSSTTTTSSQDQPGTPSTQNLSAAPGSPGSQEVEKHDLMGAEGMTEEQIRAYVIVQHLSTLASSFPTLYQNSFIASEKSVELFLRAANYSKWDTLCGALLQVPVGAGRFLFQVLSQDTDVPERVFLGTKQAVQEERSFTSGGDRDEESDNQYPLKRSDSLFHEESEEDEEGSEEDDNVSSVSARTRAGTRTTKRKEPDTGKEQRDSKKSRQ